MPHQFGVSDEHGDQNRRVRMLHRGLNLKTPPTGEPISLDEAKLWDRITQTKEDEELIPTLITAARQSVESFTGRQMNTAVWEVVYDTFPTSWGDPGAISGFTSGDFATERWGMIELPKNPLQSVDEVKYIDTAGDVQVLTENVDYTVDIISEPARITPAPEKFWPATQSIMNAVKITFTSGYGLFDADPNPVPAGIRQAMKLLILDMYQHRSAQSDSLLRENRLIDNLLYEFIIPSFADVT